MDYYLGTKAESIGFEETYQVCLYCIDIYIVLEFYLLLSEIDWHLFIMSMAVMSPIYLVPYQFVRGLIQYLLIVLTFFCSVTQLIGSGGWGIRASTESVVSTGGCMEVDQ